VPEEGERRKEFLYEKRETEIIEKFSATIQFFQKELIKKVLYNIT